MVSESMPVKAIKTDPETGAKIVHDNLCVGCNACEIACPFGTVNYNASTGKVIKCDLCGGDPVCATTPPTYATVYSDVEQAGYEKMKIWANKQTIWLQPSSSIVRIKRHNYCDERNFDWNAPRDEIENKAPHSKIVSSNS
jgi:Fe-S-cluster-containing dehydrogenase component